ncbi:MarR family winged helix-turn-helix transcriptional regulator [Gelidibacter salicanalis]|uniref:MarR family transcriptional regulator n=1 Tax=Gelidibacter salicanalis TaxID=291193 RepID=A0A934KI34_9FLAO|nr:MarR family transcriptional regulator [Gelidibacter salicanalis]MBJ7879921.1 MarR family transcriptional regulator [Gelidibacter salicanalis]
MGNLSKDINSKFANVKIKAMINVLYTANWITSFQNEFFKPHGISPQQFNILKILNGANEPLKVQTIKERMIDRSPNATRLMDKLHAKDYIKRLPSSADRRVVFIEITEKGKTLLSSISADFNDDLVKNLTEGDAQLLSDLLDKMR